MNVLEREKIRRQLYKQEKLKKKLEEEEKLKYPGINGLIRIDNISQYFIFDEDEKNAENTVKNNNIEVEYEINSYLNNEDVPDLYTPYGIISGNNYKLITTKDKDMSNENCIPKDENIDKENNEDKNNDDSRNRKIKRYFDIDKDSIYFLRCKKCGKYGHTKANCIKENNFCYICIKYGHVKKDCPIFLRCYKCLKYGHKIQNCTEEKLGPLCQNCNRSIHKKEDCLKFPDEITIKDLERHNLKCEFCGSKEHLICPYSKRENYILLYEKKDKNKDINTEMNKDDYSHQLFCPWCGGNHLKIECPERRDIKSFSESSEIKSINSDLNWKYSNDDYWGSDTDQVSDKKNKENKKEKDNDNDKYNQIIKYDDFRSWGEDNQEKEYIDNNRKNEVKKETNDNINIKDFQHPGDNNSKNTNTNTNTYIKNDKKNEKRNWGNKSSLFNSKSNSPNNNNNNHKFIYKNKYDNYHNNSNNKERNIYKRNGYNKKKNYNNNNNRDYRYKEKTIYNNNYNNEIETNYNQSMNLKEEENNNYDGKYNKNNNYRYNNNKNNKLLKNNYNNHKHKDKSFDLYELYKNIKNKENK